MKDFFWKVGTILTVVAVVCVIRFAGILRPIVAPRMSRIWYCATVATIFSLAAWLRFHLPQDPIADPDTWGYLSPALRKLTGAEFGHTHGRNFVYPGFLFLLLRLFGDLRAITVVQHLLGLMAGGILLVTWRRVRVFAPELGIPRNVHAVLGLVAMSVFLFAAEPIRIEMEIRPEGVCTFLLGINLYLVIDFAACCFIENRHSRAVVSGAGGIFTAILLAFARPSFSFASAVTLLPVTAFFLRRGSLWEKVALAGSATVAAVLFLLPEHFLSQHDEVTKTFLPTTLFVVHADLIRDQIADDLAHSRELPYSRARLQRVHLLLSEAINKSHAANAKTGRYTRLGFDPDDLRSGPSSVSEQLRRDFGNDLSALCAFYYFYYWRVWQQRPVSMLNKIASQMAVFYDFKCPAYTAWRWLPLVRQYDRGVTALGRPEYRELWTSYRPSVDFMDRTRLLAQNAPMIQQARFIGLPLIVLARTYLPILWIALGTSVFVLGRRPYRRSLGWFAALVLFAYSLNFAACLEIAIVQSMEVGRFTTVQLFPTILSQFLGIWFLCEFAAALFKRTNPISAGSAA